jgi:hypothetical protein
MQSPPMLRPEPLLNAMAAVAVGMFVGCWVLGPALTSKSDAASPAAVKTEPLTFDAMLARPDPFPYRTATPAFDGAGEPHYAEAARAKARAQLGSRSADDPWPSLRQEPADIPSQARWHYRVPDRHAVY